MIFHPPKEPVRQTVGRFAPPLWLYKGEMLDYADAAVAYERDRAAYWQEQCKQMCEHLELGFEVADQSKAVCEHGKGPTCPVCIPDQSKASDS